MLRCVDASQWILSKQFNALHNRVKEYWNNKIMENWKIWKIREIRFEYCANGLAQMFQRDLLFA